MRKHISIVNMATRMSRGDSDLMHLESAVEPATPVITPRNDINPNADAATTRNGTIFNMIMS